MKKIYNYFFSVLMLCTVSANATVWQILVNDNSFSPNSLPNVVCGDTIGWLLNSTLPHNTVSTTIPAGAPSWSAPINATTPAFVYFVPNFAGVYNYDCTVHSFSGSFTVTCSVGINELQQDISSLVYPNPFGSSVTLVNHNADAVRITDITGRDINTIPLNTSGSKSEINLAYLAPGIYFLTTMKEGIIIETRKITKAK